MNPLRARRRDAVSELQGGQRGGLETKEVFDMESIMTNRAVEAAIRYLARRGYDILDDGSESACGIVARDGDSIAFVDVIASELDEGFADPAIERASREASAGKWLAIHADVIGEGSFRFDDIALIPISSNRAMIRHHVNTLGTLED